MQRTSVAPRPGRTEIDAYRFNVDRQSRIISFYFVSLSLFFLFLILFFVAFFIFLFQRTGLGVCRARDTRMPNNNADSNND